MRAAMTSEAISVEFAETCVGAGLRRHDVLGRRGRRISGSAPTARRNAVGASRAYGSLREEVKKYQIANYATDYAP